MTYVLSNVKSQGRIPSLNPSEDELVFLNMATNWEMYKDSPCLKYLYCRSKDHTNEYFTRDEWKGKELQWFNGFKVLEWKGGFNYPEGKEPTTGFWVWRLLQEQGKDVVLVNFQPDKDGGTPRWEGHDWLYESETYKREQPKIIMV